jgi:alanyl-tRNA synthetase
MTSKELRKKYIEFFKEKGHKEIPSASLVPENDPTVLFTTAGMHPLVPYLMGENHPVGKRLVNVQKCVRTGDIDDVGDSTHNTFFEMLGNWSLGDYFKEDSIKWSWEFLTDKKWLGIDPEKIKVTVFEGDDSAPRDGESIKIWQECFKKFNIEAEIYDKEKKNNETARIFPLPKKDNWWGPAGETGPCGPDTEIFIDLGKPVNFEKCPSGDDCKPGCHCGRYIEIWNNVFMEYERRIMNHESRIKNNEKYEYVPLAQKNVDTGMGLERTLAVLNGFDNVYETDVLAPIIEKVKAQKGKGYAWNNEEKIITKKPAIYDYEESISERVIADHIRTSVFIISDGAVPSNLDRGYITRKLLRRAIRYGWNLDMPENFLLSISKIVIDIYKEFYPELIKNKSIILSEIKKEEEKFEKTLEKGLKAFYAKMDIDFNEEDVNGQWLFDLYQTYGFPPELVFEELRHTGRYLSNTEKQKVIKEFNKELQKHQQLSRTASAGKFKGGLADAGEETVKLHTTAHLLLESLRRILGDHIFQKGSNINAERLRFDFSHSEKLTDEEKKKVEDLVNEQIQKKLSVNCEEMSLEEAKKINAMGVFENKYGEKVKVYTIGKDDNIFSKEICGGPHVKNTSELGKFRIKKEQSSSAGVRRIKAILE